LTVLGHQSQSINAQILCTSFIHPIAQKVLSKPFGGSTAQYSPVHPHLNAIKARKRPFALVHTFHIFPTCHLQSPIEFVIVVLDN